MLWRVHKLLISLIQNLQMNPEDTDIIISPDFFYIDYDSNFSITISTCIQGLCINEKVRFWGYFS